MQYLDSISLIGVKEINKRIESFFQPSIQFYEYLTLKFPYRKSEGQTKYLHFDNDSLNIELWADEYGYIFEVNLLNFKSIIKIESIGTINYTKGIPYFDYGQLKNENRIINFESSNVEILTTPNDLVFKFCEGNLDENSWIGYDKMYYGINSMNILSSIIYLDYGYGDILTYGK